ncbi:9534_t:CDS:2 [Rhizophagus irregularis]|nr:9534_t:CDS:2 [Rhizophagus irregularis]
MDSKINNDIDSSSSDSTSKPSTTSIRTNNKQKVPFTLKYQLNIRKNSNDSSSTNLKKRRVTNNSNTGGNSSPKPYDMCKVPRPPNAFIIYHRNKSKELAKFKSNGKSESNERHPSKTVAEMWKEEPAEIKLQYQREADLALVEHKKKYPFYKYKPKKKDGKNKSKSQQVNNKTSKNKKSSSIKSSNDNKDNKKEISNEDDDSQVPIEHRKQAAMESAFTSNEQYYHVKSTTLETLSSEQWNAVSEIFSNVLECMGVMPHCNNPTTPIEATPTSIAPISGMSGIAPSGMSQNSIAGIDITTPTTTLDNMMMTTFNTTDYFQITAHDWNDMDIDDMGDIATNYVVPSQSASESVPPPTPTSPTDYLSWATSTHQSIDSQFAVADPITNVTEQFSQINQATNSDLFTSADSDNIW